MLKNKLVGIVAGVTAGVILLGTGLFFSLTANDKVTKLEKEHTELVEAVSINVDTIVMLIEMNNNLQARIIELESE